MRPAALVLALALWLCSSRAAADAFQLNDAGWQGCGELLELSRRELGGERVVVQSVLDWEALKPEDGVLVLHPEHKLDVEEATEFMKAGGRLAVLDDYGKGDELLTHFKIHRRTLPGRPLRYLRGRPSLPIAVPVFDTAGGEVLGLHPTVARVEHVVLNHGTGLVHPDLTPVLEVKGQGEEPVAAAIAGQVEKGRLFAMGDPSAFINQMMRYPGNRAFAIGLTRYLVDGEPTEPRGGRLYIVANEFGERGSFGGVTPLRKSIDKKLRAALDALAELRDQGFPWWLHVAVAAAAALLLAWWAVRRLGRRYQIRLPRFARDVPLVAQGGVPGRVAVLASPGSPHALALLEVRAALCEALSLELERPMGAPSALVEELGRRGDLPAALAAELRPVLALMSEAEAAVVAGQPARVSRADVLRAAAVVERVVARTAIGEQIEAQFGSG